MAQSSHLTTNTCKLRQAIISTLGKQNWRDACSKDKLRLKFFLIPSLLYNQVFGLVSHFGESDKRYLWAKLTISRILIFIGWHPDINNVHVMRLFVYLFSNFFN